VTRLRGAAWIVLGALVALPATAHAASPREGLSLGVLGSYDSFSQGGGAPPLCCGERDSWTAHGPALALRAGYGLKSWLEPALELGYAWRSGSSDNGSRQLDISMRSTTATLAVYFPLGGDRLAIVPGVYLRTGREHAEFTETVPGTTTHQVVDQGVSAPGGSLGVDVLLFRPIAVGAFVRADSPGLSQADYSLGITATWYGVAH